MAGSLAHLLDDEEGPGGWSMIENMGDAAECVEELLWLVLSQIGEVRARQALAEGFYRMVRREIPADAAFISVTEKMES